MTLREKIEVMQAFERGEQIQFRNSNKEADRYPNVGDVWTNDDGLRIYFNFYAYEYRVKPKPREVLVRVYADGSSVLQLPETLPRLRPCITDAKYGIESTVFEDSKLFRFREVLD